MSESSTNMAKCVMNRLDYTSQGNTFFKDEPGINPEVTLQDIPASWFQHGVLNIKIALGICPDASQPSGYKCVNKPLKLYDNSDRRHNKKRKLIPDQPEGFGAFVDVVRHYNETNTYKIPLCKTMELSRKYQGANTFLPDMGIVVYSVKTGESIMSNKFVVMSKRQPSVIKGMRDVNAKTPSKHGDKRMKRSEQIKALVASNKQVVEQYKAQMQRIQNLERQNEAMVGLLKQLNQMAQIGMSTQSTDVLACFRICLGATSNMHWMKNDAPVAAQAAPSMQALGSTSKKRRL